MKISDFDYYLPPEHIAQERIFPSEKEKLMILQNDKILHRSIIDFIDFLRVGDVLVLNDSKVFKARLTAYKIDEFGKKRAKLEVLLLQDLGDGLWSVLIGNARRVKIGTRLEIGNLKAEVIKVPDESDPEGMVRFFVSSANVLKMTDEFGSVPLPPYIRNNEVDLKQYQTVYAKNIGSVAAPTAGFHLSDRLLAQIRKKGVQIEYVTLHVGIGTFWPVKTENLEEHKMHSEIVEINPDTAQRINKAKREKRRVIAVGTTVVRALEGAAQIAESNGGRAHCFMPLPVYGFSGKVDIFIKPGYRFLIVDALLTNFHLPKSTLLVLVSAFVGREKILQAYQSAIKNNYRFYSFGDAMFINKKPSAFYADGCYGF